MDEVAFRCRFRWVLFTMKWSLKLGRLWGIDVYLHVTFLLFLSWVGYATYAAMGVGAALSILLLIISLFSCVLLHEYGHALTARRYGIGTADITLLPIGGVARLERMPSNPKQELLVAIAGPAVNVVIALVIGIILFFRGDAMPRQPTNLLEGGILWNLLRMNLVMILFNMLPAFPMDGGRVLRAALAMRMPYAKATRTAATIGQGMAVLFVLFGLLYGHFMLLFIAFFVWIGASNEAEDAEESSLLSGLRVSDAMVTDYRRLTPDDTAQNTVQLILQGWQADFPVVSNGQFVGIVTRQDVVTALEAGNPLQPVANFMRTDALSCSPEDDLDTALQTLRSSHLPLLPVLGQGRLIGLLTSENILEALMFRRALSQRLAPPPLPVTA